MGVHVDRYNMSHSILLRASCRVFNVTFTFSPACGIRTEKVAEGTKCMFHSLEAGTDGGSIEEKTYVEPAEP